MTTPDLRRFRMNATHAAGSIDRWDTEHADLDESPTRQEIEAEERE